MFRNNICAKYFGLLFVFLSFYYGIYISASLSLFCNIPGWEVEAIPAVLSQHLYGHAGDYTFLTDLGRVFRENLSGFDCRSIDKAIAAIEAMPLNAGPGYSLMGNDDKGVVDFVSLAFLMFGAQAQSIPVLYFVLNSISALAVLVAVRGNPNASVTVGLLLYAQALIWPLTARNRR